MSTTLGSKAVGSSVYITVDGTSTEFLVVNQGKPLSLYDDSCDGTWLLMKDIYNKQAWDSTNNDYQNSDIHAWLNDSFLNLLPATASNHVKSVKIPYRNGTGSGGSTATGASGLSTKIFLLSGYEVGFTTSTSKYFPVDGAALSYFTSNSTRIAYYSGSAAYWWLRSPHTNNTGNVWYVNTDGSNYNNGCSNTYGVRPAFILDSSLSVSDDDKVVFNAPPVITSTSSGDLGTKDAGFSVSYTVSDEDAADTVTVTETLDGVEKRSYTVSGSSTSSFDVTGEYFQKVLNGAHTMVIAATDGKEAASETMTFTKHVTKAVVSMATPMEADAAITVCSIKVRGSFPGDGTLKVEVTNNGNDTSPVWEDCTDEVEKGANHMFTNATAANGFAFNFRVTAERGLSDTGGYITSIQGGFQ